MKFKNGDEVKIVKPSDVVYEEDYTDSSTPAVQQWVDIMDDHVGQIYTLNEFKESAGWRMNGWWFLEDWLTLVKVSDTTTDRFDDAMSIV